MLRAKAVAVTVAVVAFLGACATPELRLIPRLPAGEVRTYLLRTEGTSTIDVPGLESVERTLVEATLKIEIASATLVDVTLTPTVFRREGRSVEPPPEERGSITLSGAGALVRVSGVRGAQVPLGGSLEDLGALLGAAIRRPTARLGDRWSRETAGTGGRGRATSRVSALRFVQGRRCAVVSTGASAPAERTRATNGSRLRLTGTETSATETAFAIDDGFPVHILSNAEGRFRAQAQQGGTLVVRTTTTVRLVSVSAGGPSVSPSATPTARRSTGSPPRPRPSTSRPSRTTPAPGQSR